MRRISASMSRLDGTPSLCSAFSTRCSKIVSSRSHFWPALLVTPSAIAVILPATSPMRSSATAWVRRCRLRPSLTSFSKTLPPSAWALAKAPMPASQICCADSRTAPASAPSMPCDGPAALLRAIFCNLRTIVLSPCAAVPRLP